MRKAFAPRLGKAHRGGKAKKREEEDRPGAIIP